MAQFIGTIRRRTKLGGYEAYLIEKDTFWASSTHLLEDIASYCLNPTDKGDKVNITQWLLSIQYTTPWLFSILLHGCSVFSILHGCSVFSILLHGSSVYYSMVLQYTTPWLFSIQYTTPWLFSIQYTTPWLFSILQTTHTG